MNFLKLCQEVNTYCGFQGSVSSVSVTGGYQAKIIQAVKKAWIDIQTERTEWRFLSYNVQFDTVDGTNEYSPTTIFDPAEPTIAIWNKGSILYNYTPLIYMDYDLWIRKDLTETQSGTPSHFSIKPQDNSLLIYPVTDIYSINAHYWRTPQELLLTATIPILPEKHHWIIVYKAALGLSAFVGNQSIHQDASFNYAKAWGNLMRDENPVQHMYMRPIA